MAKVLLVQPKANIKNKKVENFHFPLSLIYIGTAIEDKHQVRIYDRNVESKDFTEFLKEYNPDIVGLPSWTTIMLMDIIYLGKLVKKISPKTLVVVGGVHATVEPDSLLNEPFIDYIIRGEGEEAFLEFCDTFDKNPKKLSKLKNVNHNPTRPFIDINKWKIPNYDLVDVSKYNRIYINLSRGCPANCTFCYNAPMWGVKGRPFVRAYKTEKMIEIFKMVIEKHKVKRFAIVDDNFIFFKSKVIEICNFLKKYNGLQFICEGRADSIDDEVAAALKSAGCHYVQIGVESGSQRMLDFLNKKISVKQNEDAIKCLQRHGIWVDASMMIGMPTETREDLKKTIEFVKRVTPEHPNLKIYVLQPSALFDYCVVKGWIKKPKTLEEWSKWIGGMRWLGHNCSEIPDKELVKTIHYLWSYRLYQRKLKAFYFWLKKGNIRHILKGLTRVFIVRGHLKIPLMGMIKIRKQ